jgi:ubiquinol-cytochrome c reductase iron-sulfur subunit
MKDNADINRGRRTLVIASACAGGAATVAATVPFVASMLPSDRAKAMGAPVEADISQLAPGEKMTVEWRGQTTPRSPTPKASGNRTSSRPYTRATSTVREIPSISWWSESALT